MIARRSEWVGHTRVDGFSIVMDLIGLAVHEFLGADDVGAEVEADALVAEAYAKHR